MEQTITAVSVRGGGRVNEESCLHSSLLEIRVRDFKGSSYRVPGANLVTWRGSLRTKSEHGVDQPSDGNPMRPFCGFTHQDGFYGSILCPSTATTTCKNLSVREEPRAASNNCPTPPTTTTTSSKLQTTFPVITTYSNQNLRTNEEYLTSASNTIREQRKRPVQTDHQLQSAKLERNFFIKKQDHNCPPYFYYIAKLFILCHLINFNSLLVTYNNLADGKGSATRTSFTVMADEIGSKQADEVRGRYENGPDRLLSEEFHLLTGESGERLPNRTPLNYIKQTRYEEPLEPDNNNHRRHHHHHHHHHIKHHNRHQQNQQQQRRRRHYGHNSDFYSAADRPLVSTQKGLVRGVTQKLFTGKFVDAFLGIPFAQPPNGTYRFKHPQPNQAWPGELDASRPSSSCYQVNDTFFGSNFLGTSIWNANTPLNEDCLYLNIWTPFGVANMTVPAGTTTTNNNNNNAAGGSAGYRSNERFQHQSNQQKRPVLVWIFGGGFYSGTSSLAIYEGGVLASEEDIIVVSMNYRVSALGFLYFGRPDAPGNAGMFDQLMALQWVSDNIGQFGGDPDRVTIFGESAGAVSVALHLLSPLSRNLFSQAILQSGAATCPWGSKDSREIMANGLQLASLLNCPSNISELDAVLECLQRADPMALVSQEVGQTKTILNFPFVPVVDGSFLLEAPSESLIKSNFKQTRILLGSNNDEGNAFLIYLPEFSHCPTGSSGGGGGGPDLPRAPQQEQVRRPGTGDELASSAGDSAEQTGQQLDVANDQTRRESPMESLDLVSASGRHHNQQQQQQYGEQRQSSPSSVNTNANVENQPNESEARQQSMADSKPCKPNDYPALTREDFLRVLREDLNPYAEHSIGKEAIVFEYSNWNNPLDFVSNYDALDKIVGDYYFTCHVNELAHRYALAGNSVFMYYFKQRSSMSPWPKWMGVLHADEINFVFGEPLNQMFNYTTKEVELSRRMMKYWANFAKFGNPTKVSDNLSMAEKWPEYKDKRQYFELHGDSVRIGRGPRAKQCAFWAHYLPKLIESFDRNQCPAHPHQLHIPPKESGNVYIDAACELAARQHSQLLIKLPSVIIISLSLILVLTLTCLLVYAHRKWKWLHWGLSSSSNSAGGSN